MYTAREISPSIILSFAWRSLLFFAIYGGALCAIPYFLDMQIGISFVPIGLIGTAVAFYVGFKNNSSYERLWEARRIWGSIVNASRTWGALVLAHVEDARPEQTRLIYRHIAYINAVRIQLRQKPVWNDAQTVAHTVAGAVDLKDENPLLTSLKYFLPEQEAILFRSKRNPASQIMKAQALHLQELMKQGKLSERCYIQLNSLVQEFYNQQGAAERIKNFPFPRQYAYFSKLFVWLFILILPFGLINEFAKIGPTAVWLAVPAYIIIASVFNTMEIVGDTSENPFENAINDIPMTSICRTIEIDLREMLGEPSIPAPLTAVNNVLM